MASRDHGHTPAAWTAVLIVLAGFFVGAFAVAVLNWTVFWVGVGIIVLGVIVGKVMQMMGMGATSEPASEADSAPAEHTG